MSKPKKTSNAATTATGNTGAAALLQDGSAATSIDAATTPADENGSAGTNTAASSGDAAGTGSSGAERPQGDALVTDQGTAPNSGVSASTSGNAMLVDLKGLADALAMTGCANFDDLVDMANVGRSLIERIDYHVKLDGPLLNWSPADDPAEVVGDLFDMVVELQAGSQVETVDRPETRSFIVIDRIRHDNILYEIGDDIDVTHDGHAELRKIGAIWHSWRDGAIA